MSILDEIRGAINGAFLDDPDSAFRPSVLTKVVNGTSSAFGPPVAGTRIDQACRAFVERYDRRTRATLGIPDTDVRISVLQTNDLGERVALEQGDTVETTEPIAGIWRLTEIEQDPAAATWTAQGTPVAANG